jgi:predicted GIY-YIG superfamily endonuclease
LAKWWVYVARCADDSLYCGITVDLDERMAAHNAGTGAKYTRSRGPIVVVLRRRCADKSFALRLEHAIKQLTRREKDALVADPARLRPIVRRLRAAG